MNALRLAPPLPLIILASPVYWKDRDQAEAFAGRLTLELGGGADLHFVGGPAEAAATARTLVGGTAVLLPLSGGVQPWMIEVAASLRHAALANAYLPDFGLPPVDAALLLERNAHPACTDFFAHARLAGRPARWLATRADYDRFARAHAAVARLRAARFLKIGETEPWVINSTREPARFAAALGCEVVPVPAEDLYAEFARITPDEARAGAEDWARRASLLDGPAGDDLNKAARVGVAMRNLLQRHQADALSMACFAMIGALDTTSCLALSSLNDSADAIGACEGDLDAAVTLFLLKALGADFVWIANPIIHAGGVVDLAHCTAPRCACGQALPYRLRRHHESGRGAAPEVDLPGDRTVTLARIGAGLSELAMHRGRTTRVAHQPTCHTQVRVRISSTEQFLATLNGTHVVMSYGDFLPELRLCARLLGLKATGDADVVERDNRDEVPVLPVCEACRTPTMPA